MTRTAAIERVTLLTQPGEFPVVASQLVEALVDDSARPDAEGRLPDHTDWDPTFDLNNAAASVFEVKAALVTNRYDTNTDGQALSRSQLIAQFQSMARMYRMRIAATHRKQPPAPGADRSAVEAFL